MNQNINVWKNTMSEADINLMKNEITWTRDLLARIAEVVDGSQSDADKLHAIKWLAKQGLKGIKEE